jgi:uncharacterized phage protein (TIGR02220 family)
MECLEAYRLSELEGTNSTNFTCFEKGWESAIKFLGIKKEKEVVPFKAIIDNMNQQLGKNFKVTPTTQMHIHARWKEGFRLEDFEKVVRIKKQQWNDNPDMNIYLRPETLFGTKMNSYANETDNKAKCTTPDWM